MLEFGLQKLTLLDFPGHTACTTFTSGCNFRCPFCHNASLIDVKGIEKFEHFSDEEILAYLKRREGILDGVCFTGGEPLLQAGLPDFLKQIKNETSMLVKLDTNGTSPKLLERVLNDKLVDYVAMDIKNCPNKYMETAGISDDKLFLNVVQSAELLMGQSETEYEFRTTIVHPYHTLDDLKEIVTLFDGRVKNYFLQKYVDSGDVFGDSEALSAIPDATMQQWLGELRKILPTIRLRGV